MAEKDYHLIDHAFFSDAPDHQRVLSLPIPLRFWIATNKKLTSNVQHMLIYDLYGPLSAIKVKFRIFTSTVRPVYRRTVISAPCV